ncbi:quinol monooxygenase YgiN [Nitrobacteraceae bacterium AZCC 2146]
MDLVRNVARAADPPQSVLEALRAHAASPHMTAYAAATKDLIASRVIHILDEA